MHFNNAPANETHFFQIWIEPNVKGIAPGYEQKTFADAEKLGKLRLVASPDGAQGSVTIHADARMYSALLDGSQTAKLALDPKTQGLCACGAWSRGGERSNPARRRCCKAG